MDLLAFSGLYFVKIPNKKPYSIEVLSRAFYWYYLYRSKSSVYRRLSLKDPLSRQTQVNNRKIAILAAV